MGYGEKSMGVEVMWNQILYLTILSFTIWSLSKFFLYTKLLFAYLWNGANYIISVKISGKTNLHLIWKTSADMYVVSIQQLFPSILLN